MLPAGIQLELPCPLKLNLSLSVLGPREDGFHALHSVVAQARFGDRLVLKWVPAGTGLDAVTIRGADLEGMNSTPWKALQVFRKRSGMNSGQFLIELEKRIPIGAGLGGGSSDATAVLRGLRKIFGEEVEGLDWSEMAASIGSDCPLFLESVPVTMEGRGEIITRLDPGLAARLQNQPVIVFKPGFSVPTAAAYRRLAQGGYYRPAAAAFEDVVTWQSGSDPLPPHWNDFELLVNEWMPSLAVVLNRLRSRHGLDARMSGSGSACFVFAKTPGFAKKVLEEELAKAWGSAFWIQETVLN